MTEREWREASDMRQATMSLAAIVLIAAVLRLAGVGGAAMYASVPGEAQTIDRAVWMMRTGTLHPRGFEEPALHVYVQMGTAVARFLSGAAGGRWRSLEEASPSEFYRWARILTALAGTLTVLLVYLVGLRWGTRPALLASGLMAVVPLHVRDSQLAMTAVPLTCLTVLTLLLSLRAHEQPRALTFAAAGAAAGLAGATRYAGLLTIVLPLIAVWMTPATRPSRLLAALAALAAGTLAFLATAPYTLLDLPGFLNGYAAAANSAVGDSPASRPLRLLGALHQAVQTPALLLMSGGLVLATVRAIRGPGRVRWTLTLAFPILYLSLLRRAAPASGSFLLPIIPFVCLLTAAAVVSGVSLLRRFSIPRALRTALIAALTVATLLPAVVASVRQTRAARRPGTAALAHDWVQQHVPPGAVVAIESGRLVLPGVHARVRHLPDPWKPADPAGGQPEADYLIVSDSRSMEVEETGRLAARQAGSAGPDGRFREVARFSPSADRPGPELRIYAVERRAGAR